MSVLSELDGMILRITSNPPLVTKGSELTYEEWDERIIEIYNVFQSVVSGVNVTAYDNSKSYDMFSTDIRDRYASYDSRIWEATYTGSPSGFSGQTPEEGIYWTQVTLAEMLPNILELARFAENIDTGLDSAPIYQTEWQSFTAQDLNSNPVDITGLEAAGSGKAVVPMAVYFSLDAGGTAYDFGAKGIYLIYSTDTSTDIVTAGRQSSINSASDITNISNTMQSDADLIENDKIQLYADADATQGDGTYYVKVLYQIIDTPF